MTYAIVGDHEADIKASRIAISAPLARAMIGRERGDLDRRRLAVLLSMPDFSR